MRNRTIYWRQIAFGSFLLHLAHCGVPGYLGESATISGQFTDWMKGPRYTLEARLSNGSLIATAPIDAQGRFSIALPTIPATDEWSGFGKVESGKWIPPGCSGSVEASADTYLPLNIFFVTKNDNMPTGWVSYRNQPDPRVPLVEVGFFYIASEFRQVGEVDCDFGDRAFHTSYDMTFLPGLNRVVWTSALFDPNFRVGAHSGSVPSDVGWVEMK